jgi:ubiquinol-cytochrome c reductase cytochrome c1 subunit
MIRMFAIALASIVVLMAHAVAQEPPAVEAHVEPKDVHFEFEGPFGTFDRAQLQRGFQVYKEVCSACHGLRLVAFRNLGEPGGPFDVPGVDHKTVEAQVKKIAFDAAVPDIDAEGQPTTRPGIPADRFVSPFPNERAARAANNGAAPPDLSVIVKARPHGVAYVYSILTGYENPPPNFKLQEGMSYNRYFQGHQIAMIPPLTDARVAYADGTVASIDQQAQDVVAFLAWAAEPKAEERKRLGFKVVIFLLVLAGLLDLSYRRVWRDTDH